MAREVILAEQTIEFVGQEVEITPSPFVLSEGETYRVVWDGVEYECVCAPDEIYSTGCPSVGDLVMVDGAITEGSFHIVYGTTEVTGAEGGVALFLSADTEATSHTVAIYQEVESEGTSIVLKDRNGNDVIYEGIKTVTFDTPTEGEQATFSYGVVAPKMEVPVTFADGDMPIVADEKTLIKEIVLLKPDNLIPENIRSGESVAGVLGTFSGGAIFATGSFTGDGNAKLVAHGLGCIPDFVIVSTNNDITIPSQHFLFHVFGCSKALYDVIPIPVTHTLRNTSQNTVCGSSTKYIDLTNTNGIINNATDVSFQIGTTAINPYPDLVYNWLAIGGLT